MAELIKTTDSLNDGRKKLNDAITDSNAALSTANTAKQTANLAKAESESTQTQLDTIVIEGDSSVEAAQARVNNSGTAFPTLKQRLDAEHQEVTAQLQQIAINVKTYGAKGDGVTDDTLAIQTALKNHTNIYFPEGEYVITIDNTNRNALHWFEDIDGIQLKGNNATIKDMTAYGTETLVNIFGFKRCSNIEVDLNYKGLPVNKPDENLSLLGATFCYFEENCKNIKVDGNIENARYGVRSGDYLNPLYGYCSIFNLNINAKMVGYPVALYLSDNVNAKITSDGTVRTTYLAGVNNADIKVSSKNYYKAAISNLLTNSITTYSDVQNEQRARGCSDIKIVVTDLGSEKFTEFTHLIGLSLQWVAQGTEHSDIDAKFHINSTDTLSSKLGGFLVSSQVKDTYPVPFNWEPYIKIRNIKISGIIDRSKQTSATNSTGELYIKLFDDADSNLSHSPEVSNFIIDNVLILKGQVQTAPLMIGIPNIKDVVKINSLIGNGISLYLDGGKGRVEFNNSDLHAVSILNSANHLVLNNSKFVNIDLEKANKITTSDFEIARASSRSGVRRLTLVTNGSEQYYFNNAIKSNALTKAIIVDVFSFPSTGSIQVGNVSSPTAYGQMPISTSGTTKFVPFYYTPGKFPFMASESVRVTFVGTPSYPNGTRIDLYIFEEEFN